jgi:chloramphenicol-sensitive protein RarD
MSSPDAKPLQSGGMPYALGAYLLWGLLPLYLRLVHDVPPVEFVGWRTLFTLPVCAAIILVTRQGSALLTALANRRTLALLALSSALIGANWMIYVLAVQAGHIFAASLGYYINPLMNVVLATAFLGERLSRGQWLAVALAGLGVAILAAGAWQTLGVSLALAASFAFYGLVRRHVAVPALTGLTIEASLLTLPAIGFIAFGHGANGIALGGSLPHDLLIALSGVVTAIPLLLFATAARRMSYSLLGFVQFLAPTLVFFEGLWLFNEPLRPIQLASFALIWSALAVFCWDIWARRAD